MPWAIALFSDLPKILCNDVPLDTPQQKAIVLSSSLSELLRNDASIELNQGRHTAKGTEVLLIFSVTLPDGVNRDLLALPDYGAQVNFVRRGLLNSSHLRTSSQAVRLKVPNRTPMIGGT